MGRANRRSVLTQSPPAPARVPPGGRPQAYVRQIGVLTAQLPFRFSFSHSLAERSSSTNIYVKVTLSDGTVGYGEGVPREYVTGETADLSASLLCDVYAPQLLGREVPAADEMIAFLNLLAAAGTDNGTDRPRGAAWCALELALMDAVGHQVGLSAAHWLGPVKADQLEYDAVLPFTSRRKVAVVALAVRMLGIHKVKVKVGRDLDEDLRTLRTLRRLLGSDVDLRVDANCAWKIEEALRSIERMRPYRLSVIEQPVAADDVEGLRRLTANCEEVIAVDESLRTLTEARSLAETAACRAFNIRVSKCGGLLESMRIARVAEAAGLLCIVGAQVGESGILSAAGRHLAACTAPRYLEGSAGRLLLKEDLTVENVLPGWGGRARAFAGPGLGVRVREDVLRRHARFERQLLADELRHG